MRSLDAELVPPFEEHEARLQKGIPMDVWYEKMDSMERAFVIAMFRIGRAMKNLQAEAEIRHSKAKTRT